MARDRMRRFGRAQRTPEPDNNRPTVSLEHAAPDDARSFAREDTVWLAWISGHGAGGTGDVGHGMMDAIHFAPADQPGRPRFEVLLAQGRFSGLYDEELVSLLAGATEIVIDGIDQKA